MLCHPSSRSTDGDQMGRPHAYPYSDMLTFWSVFVDIEPIMWRALAINTVVQGSAADLIKRAMLRLEQRRADGELPADLLLQIHDELVFEARDEEVQRSRDLIISDMTSAMDLEVPLVVDVSIGRNWLGEP